MSTKVKIGMLASAFAVATLSASATTNLLQSVNVAFTVFSQGPTNVSGNNTNYTVDHARFDTKALIAALSPTSNFVAGEELVRATPVETVPVTVTNLVTNGTITLEFTNTSTSTSSVSNEVIVGGMTYMIGTSNVTFGTNLQTIGGSSVTIGTNVATFGTNSFIVGTNTTVTATALTDTNGYNTGTNYVFVSNTLTNSAATTNVLGTAVWDIYTPRTKTLTPINTNVTFNIYPVHVHDDGTNIARIHGEVITRNHVVIHGTTDEVRAFVLSNANWNIRLIGYAEGRYIPVNLGGSDLSYSQNFNWFGAGSGTSNTAVVVVEGYVTEDYFKFLKQ
jgi:hypothetical protein